VLCLLGPPAIATAKGLRPVALRPKALALLARVALSEEKEERRVLAELLFHEAVDPRDSLRWHLSYLRARLPDTLVVERTAVSFCMPTDVAAFRSGVRRIFSDPSAPEGDQTLALYRGDLCSGLHVAASADFHNWLYVQEDELRRTFRRAAVAYARAAHADGRAAAAMPSLRHLTEIDPTSRRVTYCSFRRAKRRDAGRMRGTPTTATSASSARSSMPSHGASLCCGTSPSGRPGAGCRSTSSSRWKR
jgi:DNA-binding SARP family transcriptional activator